jgi:small-conductance mechanosensitive channel
MKQRKAHHQAIVLPFLLLVILLSACTAEQAGPTPTPPSAPRLTMTVAAVPTASPDQAGSATPESTSEGIAAPIEAVEGLSQIVASRTPAPTARPDRLERGIEEFVNETGLEAQEFLGLSSGDWINILASVLVFAVIYALVNVLLFRVAEGIVRRTKTGFDDDFLLTIETELKWLVAIIAARIAVLRLDFWNETQVLFLVDSFFFLRLVVILIIAVRLIRFGGDWFVLNRVPASRQQQVMPLVLVSKRLGYLLAILTAGSFALNHLGINIAGIVVFLLFFVAVIVLGAREAIDDTASGFLILLDPQYRVGDDIHLKELETWGKVVEIGLRNTHIQTLDNRYIIIPNTKIGKSQIVNYSYPDPVIRLHSDIEVAYGTDIGQMRQVIEEAVRGVEGVLPDRPVHAYFLAFGAAGRQVRVMWWIANVDAKFYMLDRVNGALEEALDAADIEITFPTYNLNLAWERDETKRMSP